MAGSLGIIAHAYGNRAVPGSFHKAGAPMGVGITQGHPHFCALLLIPEPGAQSQQNWLRERSQGYLAPAIAWVMWSHRKLEAKKNN